jgi:hypothetical protein
MRPLTWALKEVDLVGIHSLAVNSIIMSGIAPKQNAFKFKIAPHKQKSIVKKIAGRCPPPPLANGALCTPKHNGKSGTEYNQVLIDNTYGTWVEIVEWIICIVGSPWLITPGYTRSQFITNGEHLGVVIRGLATMIYICVISR